VKITDAKEWLTPQYRSADSTALTDEDTKQKAQRVTEVFRVARDLKLLDADRDEWVSSCELPSTHRELARHVHAHLRGLPTEAADAVLLRAYSWCVAYSEVNGTAALVGMTASDLARDIAAALGRNDASEDEKSFNTTKLPAWKDWMSFLGLGWNDLPGTRGFLPDPSKRIEEELLILIPSKARLDAATFIAPIAEAFPYLDGGVLFREACDTAQVRPPQGQLSRVLSQALRALENNEVLKCGMEGDSKKGVALFPDPLSSRNNFSYVERGEASDV